MLSSLTSKIALKKVGLSKDAFDFSGLVGGSSDARQQSPEPNKVARKRSAGVNGGLADDDGADPESPGGAAWPGWMSLKSLPLTIHPWLAPPPPLVTVGRLPQVGDVAPLDRDRKLEFGGGRRVLVVFLRCVGCAFAQKTFLQLRTLANRHSGKITCIAVSHSSEQTTRKWIDLIGGAWHVRVVVDEDRAIYAAWGLSVAGVWHLFNLTTQMQGWREKGWLGEKVAEAVQRRATVQSDRVDDPASKQVGAVSTVLGNKWQEAGAFAVDGRGTIAWGGKAQRADDVMDLEEGIHLLSM